MMCLHITRRVQFQIFGTSRLSEYRPCVQGVNALWNVLWLCELPEGAQPNLLNSIGPSTDSPAIP